MADGFGDFVVVPATLNGTERRFLVTTGRGLSSVTPLVARELGVASQDLPSKRQVYDFNGNRFRRFITVSSVNIGGSEGKDFDFLIEPDENALDPRLAGAIAKNILGNFDVEFDFVAKKLNLLSQEHCEGRVVYWSKTFADVAFRLDKNGNILVPMSLDGKAVEAMIDTASPTTRLDIAVARRLFGLKEGAPGVERIADAPAGSPVQYRYRFKSFSFENVSVENPLIDLFDNAMKRSYRKETDGKLSTDRVYGAEELETADVILGLNVLRKLRLYVAYAEQKLYVTAADAR
jgi:predicted aspartyl protease